MLAQSLESATQRFMASDSIAREVLGDDFVEHFGGTREHEVKLWNEAVTNWEGEESPCCLFLCVGRCRANAFS
jgi:glutamine synthetase